MPTIAATNTAQSAAVRPRLTARRGLGGAVIGTSHRLRRATFCAELGDGHDVEQERPARRAPARSRSSGRARRCCCASVRRMPSSSAMAVAVLAHARRPGEAPLGEEHGEEQEEIEERKSEQAPRRAHGGVALRHAADTARRARRRRAPSSRGDDAVGRRRHAESAAAPARRRRQDHRIDEDLALGRGVRRRPPAASARRPWRSRRTGRATAPRNAAASTGR